MAGIQPRAVVVPTVIETFGSPEYFGDGAIFLDRGEIITVVYFVERIVDGAIQNIEVCRVHRARRRWMESLERANAMLLMVGTAH